MTFFLCRFFVVQIFVILVLVFVALGLGLGLLLLGLVLLVLHGLLGVLERTPDLLSNSLGLLDVVGDENVVEDGSRLDLPQVEADLADLVVLAQFLGGFRLELGIVDHGVDPLALVSGVVDLAGLPLTLELRVVDHGWLPFAVHLIIPILRLKNEQYILQIFFYLNKPV